MAPSDTGPLARPLAFLARARLERAARPRPCAAAFAVCALLALAGERPALAQCASAAAPGLPCLSQPWETVDLEHRDRMARLKRLAAGQAGFAFHEDRISPAEHGLADFPADIPVLRVVADQDVFFDSGSDLVRPEAYRVLDAIAASLKKEPPDVVLFVGGHTDAQGPEEENMALGLARADQVASGLLRRGIYQAAIYRVSFGEHLPVAGNGTARERARNRRVEFLFGARPEALVAEIRRQSGPCLAPGPDGTPGDCRRALQFLVERMTVEKDYAKAIVDLDLRTQSIEKDMTRTSVEKTAERQVVEIERQRIPIKISRDKIVVPLVR